MAQDLRELLRDDQIKGNIKMSEGHKARFLEKLNEELPQEQAPKRFNFWGIAASIAVLLGLTYGGLQFGSESTPIEEVREESIGYSTLGDVSPELKKVEDFYLASINMQLSKIKLTPENKELFDGYLNKLEELNKEYDKLNLELTENGPNALTVDALINNLKLRLNLLVRLQDQIKLLETETEDNPAI
ncbi:MAG: hypothetical protein AAGH46_04555 [Bacteroidota bacterium]